MAMSRKHYIAVAEHLNSVWVELDPGSKLDQAFMGMVDNLCWEFQSDNAHFDKERFVKAVTRDDG